MTDQSPPVDPGSAPDAVATPVVTGFRPMRMPSQPFVIALLGAIVAIAILVLSTGVLFIFVIGVALSFFLVPIVNWLERRGWNRVLGSIACGFAVSGIIGAILALPLAAIARDVFKHFFDKAQDASAVLAEDGSPAATASSRPPVAAPASAPTPQGGTAGPALA